MPAVEVEPGTKLYYESWGKGQPVVLVHALSMNHRFWESQVVALADHYRVIVYDQRAHGQSDKPDCPYLLQTYTDDLEKLITALELRDVNLVGCSIGAWIALDYTSRKQHRVSRLMLVSASPKLLRGRDWDYGVPAEFFENFLKRLSVDRMPATQDFYRGLLGTAAPAHLLAWVVQTSLAMPLIAFLRSARNVVYADRRRSLAQIEVPTLILNGAYDRACPAPAAEYMATNMRQARFVTLGCSAHFPNMEEVSNFNAELLSFLESKTDPSE